MTTVQVKIPVFSLKHRPLNWLTIASAGAALAALVYYVTDSRELLGVSIREKPL